MPEIEQCLSALWGCSFLVCFFNHVQPDEKIVLLVSGIRILSDAICSTSIARSILRFPRVWSQDTGLKTIQMQMNPVGISNMFDASPMGVCSDAGKRQSIGFYLFKTSQETTHRFSWTNSKLDQIFPSVICFKKPKRARNCRRRGRRTDACQIPRVGCVKELGTPTNESGNKT